MVRTSSTAYKFEALRALLQGASLIADLKGPLREKLPSEVEELPSLEFAIRQVVEKMGEMPWIPKTQSDVRERRKFVPSLQRTGHARSLESQAAFVLYHIFG